MEIEDLKALINERCITDVSVLPYYTAVENKEKLEKLTIAELKRLSLIGNVAKADAVITAARAKMMKTMAAPKPEPKAEAPVETPAPKSASKTKTTKSAPKTETPVETPKETPAETPAK